MKKVIFLCLLSLSVCLSKPAVDQAASKPATVGGAPVDPKTSTAPQVPVAEIPQANTTEPQAHTNTTANPELKPQQNSSEIHSTVPALPTNTTTNTKSQDNKTTDKQMPPKEQEEKPTPKNATDTKAATAKINTTESAKEVVTTQKTPTKPTEVPKAPETPKPDEDKHVLQARGFDGASFIGGIILTLGLLAIGFMGFKYYKNQTERNYHTL